ncbi:MAG: redoxin domain-containing protein [Pirellulales bacterium]
MLHLVHGVALRCVVVAGLSLAALSPASAQQNPHGIVPLSGLPDPLLLLLHDPIVHEELKLAPDRLRQLRTLCDEMDPPLWTTRNQSPVEATRIRDELKRQAAARLAEILSADQRRRLTEIERRTIGIGVLLRDDLQAKLQLSEDLRSQIGLELRQTQAAVEQASQKLRDGVPRDEIEREVAELHAESQKKIWALLSDAQKKAARDALGTPVALAKLGQIKFLAPEFPAAVRKEEAWLQSPPLSLRERRGEVVVVFLWAHGCINCIRNYPWYVGWHKDFASQGVRIIGVHTPETDGERDVETLQRKVKDNGFEFPVVVDNDRAIWNAWGNSMWPSTYVIDKKGYVRAWWLGELNWEGQKGEELLRKKIKELVEEP